MSFVDLATLTMHRRHELDSRIRIFDEKCVRAINDIYILKMKANGFVSQLNCEPSELKERFLSMMQKLDEYIYLITDFNLAMAQTADTVSSEHTPVQDSFPVQNSFPVSISLSPFNLIDALTEPSPATSHACPNLCPPQKPLEVKTPKEEQRLIVFSSSSSAESVPRKSEKEIQCQMVDEMANLSIRVSEPLQAPPPCSSATECNSTQWKECCITAAQPVLEIDREYPATIMCVDGGSFWVITEDPAEVARFMTEMTDYYMNNQKTTSAAELADMTYCAYYDENFYYRAMFLEKPKRDQKTVNVYVVDTGEIRSAEVDRLQPLVKQFCDRPPYARFCHLAGVDLRESYQNKELMMKQEAFMKEYGGTPCTILVDDNSSESLGVYVILPSKNTTLNDLLVENRLAIQIDKPLQVVPEVPAEAHGPPEPPGIVREPPGVIREPPGITRESPVITRGPPRDSSDEEFNMGDIDIATCPEYEDPVVAVTGYHNRDEADICKHYKGGPEKTCFKGTRCTKKHILHHPGVSLDTLNGSEKSIEFTACSYRSLVKEISDGWTLDQVEVVGSLKSVPLPAPGSWLKVLVTAVCHFDRVYVQIVEDTEEEEVPEFGVVLPPMTLESLRRDMNSPATIQAYKKLTMSPAPGEFVAALYPLDNCWYRARVQTLTRADQSVEVMYVDYGTVLWVKEDGIRALEPRFTLLPQQGVQCVLAGVQQRGDSAHWARARRALADMLQDRQVDMHVICREFDEIVVELITYDDPQDAATGESVAERLAERGLVDLVDYTVMTDDHITHKLVVP